MPKSNDVVTGTGGFGLKLIEAFGLQDQRVVAIHIKCDADAIVNADINVYVQEWQAEQLLDLLVHKRYALIDREELDRLQRIAVEHAAMVVRDSP